MITYSDYIKRTSSNVKSVCTILNNCASRTHFEALHNSSRLLARVGPKGFRLGTGTMRNEQVHRMSNIYQSHRGRLQIGLRVFELAKLLTHSSAAYSPTLIQTSQQRLLSILSGKMRQTSFLTSNSARDSSIVRESLQLCRQLLVLWMNLLFYRGIIEDLQTVVTGKNEKSLRGIGATVALISLKDLG